MDRLSKAHVVGMARVTERIAPAIVASFLKSGGREMTDAEFKSFLAKCRRAIDAAIKLLP